MTRFLSNALVARAGYPDWDRYCSPRGFYPLVGTLVPWLAAGAFILTALGLYVGLVLAPADAPQGGIYRIVFVHVPATWMSVFIFVLMAFWAGIGLLVRTRLPGMMAQALAPTGTMFAFMALWTGSLWGKPAWGGWWIWDVRLIAGLVLLLLYMAVMALYAALDDVRRADRIAAVVALFGAAIVPLNMMSVAFFPRIHQNPSVILGGSSDFAVKTIVGLLAVAAGFWMYGSAAALMRLRCVILERERHSDWVTQCSGGNPT